MKNMDMKVKGKKLVITIDLEQDNGLSSSGKSKVIATSSGNQPIPGNEEVKIGLNVYRKA